MNSKDGFLKIYMGPMFSGKSTQLLIDVKNIKKLIKSIM